MTTYRVTLTATYEIDAENVAQARLVARRIRSIGEVVGGRRGPHDRDEIRYVVRRVSERLAWEPRVQDGGAGGTAKKHGGLG